MGVLGVNSTKDTSTPELSPGEWMVALLGADNASPIFGKTAFVKQLFVLGKEVESQVDAKFAFFASRFGPYSSAFEPALTHLIKSGLVSEQRVPKAFFVEGARIRHDFSLTPKGVELANRILARIPESELEKITTYKRVLSTLGFWGLIHYVYTKYPEYTVFSELRPEEEPLG